MSTIFIPQNPPAWLAQSLEHERLAAGIYGADLTRAARIYRVCTATGLPVTLRDALRISRPVEPDEHRHGEPGSVTPASANIVALRLRYVQAEQIAAGKLELRTLANGARVAQAVQR